MRVGGGQRRVPAPSVAGAGGAVCALLWVLGGAFLLSGGPESVGVGSGLQDVAVEGEPVRDGGGQARVGERRSPLAERRVGGDRDAGAFVAFGEDLEQQLGAARVQVQIAELVEADQVEAAVAGDGLGQDPVVGGFDELVDQCCGGGVAHAATLVAGGDAEGDEQVRFAGAGVAEQDQRLTTVDPRAARQGGEQPGWDRRGGGGVERLEGLDPGEVGFVDAALPSADAARVGLGGEQLGEVAAVGEPAAHGGVGGRAGLGAHGGQVQAAAGRVDRRGGGVVADHGRDGHGRGPIWVMGAGGRWSGSAGGGSPVSPTASSWS